MGLPQFEWDADNARKNLAKQRVSFDEAPTVLLDTPAISRNDPDDSLDEERRITFGRPVLGNPLVVGSVVRANVF